MKSTSVMAVVLILVVSSLGVGYLAGGAARRTETITSVSTRTTTSTTMATLIFSQGVLVPTPSASTLNPATGLSLTLNLSTNSNGRVVVTAYEFNTLDRVNNVSYGSSWPNASLWQWTTYDCSEGSMMGFEVLQGNYGSNNYSDGMALWTNPPAIAQGGCFLGFNDSYSFDPLSVRSLISGTYAGYWIEGQTYVPFVPGMYTVLAGDQWGQVAILRFIVAG